MRDAEPNHPQRRAFFRAAVARAIGPLADYIEKRVGLLPLQRPLRPPGAIEESAFLETCYRCGSCVEVCPADAIFPLDDTAGDAARTPSIDPDRAACVVCDDLKCTTVCPSGALQLITDPLAIRIGLAQVYGSLCTRSNDVPCTECVDRCPPGAVAIRFNDDGPPEVLSPGCIGCGICQLYCPTSPKAIVVNPI